MENFFILIIGLAICFGGIYLRKPIAFFIGLFWGALVTAFIIFSNVGIFGWEDGYWGIVAFVALITALVSAVYDNICVLLNSAILSFLSLILITEISGFAELTPGLLIVFGILSLGIGFLTMLISNYAFIVLTALTGALIASVGGLCLFEGISLERLILYFNDEYLNKLIIGFVILSSLGIVVQMLKFALKSSPIKEVSYPTAQSPTPAVSVPKTIPTIQNPEYRTGGKISGAEKMAVTSHQPSTEPSVFHDQICVQNEFGE
ncbi:MAG: DUF4203 domain-containing protein [Oscillospiraceae bacterium]|nr:DUF4203 domain-containing protein [Oscillospiraceae bacterium]